jgi:hypothetical protein
MNSHFEEMVAVPDGEIVLYSNSAVLEKADLLQGRSLLHPGTEMDIR